MSKGKKSGKKNRSRSSNGGGTNVAGLRGVVRGDLSLVPRRPSSVPRGVPSSFANQICWRRITIDSTIAPSSSLFEQNYSFSLGQDPEVANLQSVFDSYHIAQAAVTWANLESPSSSVTFPVLHSAIDFDNTTSAGSLAVIEGYESHTVDILGLGKSVTRMCRPCVSVNAGTTGSAGIGVVNSRAWLDCVTSNTPHYGIRGLFEANPSGTANVHVTQTLWIAFRMGI